MAVRADPLIAVKAQASAEAAAAAPVDAGVDLTRLRFRYRVEGDWPPWRPLSAFDDGRKVYIEMPAGLAQGEAPPLFVLGADGKGELVNYRVRGTYYVVDRLFGAAELRLGGTHQQVVRVVRTDTGRGAVRHHLTVASRPELVPGGGSAAPLGATVTPAGVNFAVCSETASAIWVCLFDEVDREIGRFELDGHQGHVHFGLIAAIGAGARYGLRADGPYEPDRGLLFDPLKLLVDPYARQLDRAFVRTPELGLPRERAVDTAVMVPKAIVLAESNGPARRPMEQRSQLFYELNVRGYTKLRSDIEPELRGTVAGLMHPPLIEHLLMLGVDAVELMPVAAFIDDTHLPALGLHNVWGYNPVAYFAPDPRLMPGGIGELRAMTDFYRTHGISVILDVVYNHTGESDTTGPMLSLKGLDAQAYYRQAEIDGRLVLVNDTGTGNTLQCDHLVVQRLVIDSLRYWVEQGGVSGFRFDLATVLGREPGFDPHGRLLELIRADPVLGRCTLVAEPWDVGPGGYQLGQFGEPFREWNDRYRDEVRRFWAGDAGTLGALATRIAGSADRFGSRVPSSSVNFLAAHDGFTLADLVSYGGKHNEGNGEGNRDGHGDNHSWNNGVEGLTEDAQIRAARQRDLRALLATLFVSRGSLLLQQGDEFGRTQGGNNNAYAQDNEITWVDWDAADTDLAAFAAAASAFRTRHPALTADVFLTGELTDGVRDAVWLHADGREMITADWDDPSASVLGLQLCTKGNEVLVWFNRQHADASAALPCGQEWAIGLNSTEGASVANGRLVVPARSVVVLER